MTPDDNVVCPVKVPLMQALRLAHTDATTTEELLAQARRRRDHRIVWKPEAMDRPVIPAIAPAGSQLLVDRPALPQQVSQSVQATANALGILVPVSSHDVRRGSAQDIVYLGEVAGTSNRGVAAALGHSEQSRRKGVTTKYIGPVKEDLWSKRLEMSE